MALLFHILLVFTGLVVIVKLFVLKSSVPNRILDIYSVPGKWYHLKFYLVLILMHVRKVASKLSAKKDERLGYGVQSHKSPDEMDRKQPLSKDTKAFDAVYINGSNRIGWYIIAGLARRPTNADGFFILKVPGVGLLLSPQMPDTTLPLCPHDTDSPSFSSRNLVVTPIKPMQTWRLQYNGNMRISHNPRKKVKVFLDAVWESNSSTFNYDVDILPRNVAQAMATEEWTRHVFNNLKEHHQTHYEQFGDLKGSLTIDDVGFNLNISAMRGHSFGVRREWKVFHRYALHMFTLADGRRGNVGVVSIPNLFSRLEFGYLCGKDGISKPIHECDFELYHHGESGKPPNDYGFTFYSGDEFYEVNVNSEENTELFLGLEWESRVVESLSRFTVNGVEGWGVVEWMYTNSCGRPPKSSQRRSSTDIL